MHYMCSNRFVDEVRCYLVNSYLADGAVKREMSMRRGVKKG